MSVVSIAHFVAFLLPALNFYIFCGRDYVQIFIKVVTPSNFCSFSSQLSVPIMQRVNISFLLATSRWQFYQLTRTVLHHLILVEYLQVGARGADSPNLSPGEEELGGQSVQLSQVTGVHNPSYAGNDRGDNIKIQAGEIAPTETKTNDNSSFVDFLIPLDD